MKKLFLTFALLALLISFSATSHAEEGDLPDTEPVAMKSQDAVVPNQAELDRALDDLNAGLGDTDVPVVEQNDEQN